MLSLKDSQVLSAAIGLAEEHERQAARLQALAQDLLQKASEHGKQTEHLRYHMTLLSHNLLQMQQALPDSAAEHGREIQIAQNKSGPTLPSRSHSPPLQRVNSLPAKAADASVMPPRKQTRSSTMAATISKTALAMAAAPLNAISNTLTSMSTKPMPESSLGAGTQVVPMNGETAQNKVDDPQPLSSSAGASAKLPPSEVLLPAPQRTSSHSKPKQVETDYTTERILEDAMRAKRRYTGFDNIVGAAIVLNAAFVGCNVQYGSWYGVEPAVWVIGEAIFCVIFIADLAFRLHANGCSQFFIGTEYSWNIFDLFIVFTMALDMILSVIFHAKLPVRLSIARTIRLLRILRVARVLREMRRFREFNLLLKTMQNSCHTFFWSISVIIFFLYIVGIFMTEGTLEYCVDGREHDLCSYFGRIDMSILSLYKSMTYGVLWSDVLETLKVLHPVYSIVFVCFVSFHLLIVSNIIAGIVYDLTRRIAIDQEEVFASQIAMREQEAYIRQVLKVFNHINVNNSGDISRDAFSRAVQSDKRIDIMHALKMEVFDINTIFDMLDFDASGQISLREFVYGCLRFRGGARSVDVEQLKYQVAQLKSDLVGVLSYISTLSPVTAFTSHEEHVDAEKDRDSPSFADSSEESPARESIENVDAKKKPEFTRHSTRKATSAVIKDKMMSHGLPKTYIPRRCIEHAENRALALFELQDVYQTILDKCTIHHWQDMRTGKELKPEDVNLYHFNYHYICPQTAPAQVTLAGLPVNGSEEKGQRVMQLDAEHADAKPLADGLLEEVTSEGNIKVSVLRGRFRIEAGCSIFIDGCNHNEPTAVLNPGSFSYKELISNQPLTAKWYCCHWWGETIRDFVRCVQMHADSRDLREEEANYWVCAYANRQLELGKDISSDPEASSFSKALSLAQGVLLILDDKATPFRRIWCDFEIYKTISDPQKHLDIATIDAHVIPRLITDGLLPKETAHQKMYREAHFPLNVLTEGVCIELQDGESSFESDKIHILQIMDGTTQSANNSLHAHFAMVAWPMAVKQGRVYNFGEKQSGLSLPEVLTKDEWRQHFRLCLADSSALEDVRDTDVFAVAEGLPHHLSLLDLSFEGSSITDRGLQRLAARLPRSLECLLLDLTSCKRVTDAGVCALVDSLPAGLCELKLYCANCPLIGEDSILHLASRCPTSVKVFCSSFLGTRVDKEFTTLDQLRDCKSARRRRQSWGRPSSKRWMSQSSTGREFGPADSLDYSR